MKKLLFVTPTLNGGGAEKVTINLINGLKEKSSVEIVLVVLNSNNIKLEIPSNIEVELLDFKSVRKSSLKLRALLKLHKPDVVFSSIFHLNIILAIVRLLVKKKYRLVIRESGVVSKKLKDLSLFKRSIFKVLYHFYKLADLVIVQSDYMKKDLIKAIKINKDKVVKIYNPINISEVKNLSNRKIEDDPASNIRFIYVGRLEDIKQVEKIITFFTSYYNKFQTGELYILGEGSKKEQLILLCRKLNVEKLVYFKGYQANPYPYIKSSDFLLLASKHEGLPNVVIESLILGTNVMSLRHPGGTKEILEIADIEANFVAALNLDNFNRLKLRLRTSNLLKEFDSKKIISKYQEVLYEETNT